MRKTLEIAMNVTVIAVGIAVLYTVGTVYHSKPGIPPALKPGASVPTIAELNLPASSRTLLLFLRKGCHYCEESLPFYQRLNGAAKSNSESAKLMALFPDSNSDAGATLQHAGIDMPYTGDLDFNRFGVAATPTLLLVDETGKIHNTWIGKLQSAKEQEVMQAVAATSTARR